MKVCSKCKITKTETSFYKNKSRKGGLQADCKACCKENNAVRWSKNIKKCQHYSRIFQLKNPSYNKDSMKIWRQENTDKCNNYTAKRRALKLKATPLWAELEKTAIKEMYAEAKRKTMETGIKYHVDHIVPLKSDIVQGFHCLANLQVIDAKHNQSKSNRVWPNMPDYNIG